MPFQNRAGVEVICYEPDKKRGWNKCGRNQSDKWPTRFRPRVLLESRRRFEEMTARRLDAPARAELDALVQRGQANDAAVKRFEEYLDLTADV